MPTLYSIRAGVEQTEAFVNEGFVAIGTNNPKYRECYLRDMQPYLDAADRETLVNGYQRVFPEISEQATWLMAGYLWRLAHVIRLGDYVIIPDTDNERLHVGEVVGEYYYDSKVVADGQLPHRRKVNWRKETLLRSNLPLHLQKRLRSPHPLLTIKEKFNIDELYRGLEAQEQVGNVESIDADLDSTQDRLYEAVLERILELDPEEFEVLITELLATLGFEARHVGQVGDGGIDAVGTLDVYGMARIELHVQCKRYRLDSRINAKEIRDFRGAIPQNAQACFITTTGYAKRSLEEANREGFKRIGLVNGRRLVEILADKYPELPDELQERLRLRRVLIPE